MGICEVLTIIFVMLKCLGVITWSWWLVFLPEIIAVAFYIVVLIIYMIQVCSINKSVKEMRDNFPKW